MAELERMLGRQRILSFVFCVLATSYVGGAAPCLKNFFSLQPLWSILVSAFALFFLILARQFRGKSFRFVACLLVAYFFVHLYFGVLIITSSGHGAIVFAGPWILCGALQGRHFRNTISNPYLGISIGLAIVITTFLSKTSFQLELNVLSGSIAMSTSFIFGSYAAEKDRLLYESNQLRFAVTAQMLREKCGRSDQLSVFVDQIAMSNHNIRNTLTIAIGNTSLLERTISEEPSEEDLKKAVQKIRKSLGALSTNLHSMTELSRQQNVAARNTESVDIVSLVEITIRNIQSRFEDAKISMEITKQSIVARIGGGDASLRRMLDNLIINACEGNGQLAAKFVVVKVIESTHCVEIRVEDDGPGFSESQLVSREIFKTTKAQGIGLGLYTTEQLVMASGGLLEKNNLPSGGAVASIKLPRVATSQVAAL